MYRPTYAKISLENLSHNIGVIAAELEPRTALLAVVKSDAYGHGMIPVAKRALQNGAGGLCVALAEEGEELRRSGVSAPVLVLGAVSEGGARASVENGLIQAVFDRTTVKELAKAAKAQNRQALLDIKIDTGMNRIGVKSPEELRALLEDICSESSLSVHGAFTHFAAADEASPFTREQYERFVPLAAMVRERFPAAKLHASASAALFLHKYAAFDAVRAGIALYGVNPAPGVGPALRPVMSVYTHIVHVKRIEAGETVSYGRTFTAASPRVIATLPIGYGDGYKRLIGNVGCVLIGGRRAPVVGRVCMDQMMADVTGIEGVRTGDEAVLLGSQGTQTITAQEMAGWAQTIPYEITLSFTHRVPRIYD